MAYNIPKLTGTVNQVLITQLSSSQQLGFAVPVIRSTQPAFFANLSANVTNSTGDGTQYNLLCNNEVFDQGNNYDPSTGLFTAPVTGKYLFCYSLTVSNLSVGHTALNTRLINPTNPLIFRTGLYNPFVDQSSSGLFSMSFSTVLTMASGTTMVPQVIVSSSTKTVTIVQGTNATFFCGYLIC